MIEELLAYQEVDAKLRKIEMELANSEEKKKAVSARAYIEGVEDNINKLDSKAAELALAFENVMAEQEKLSAQKEELEQAAKTTVDDNGANFLMKKADEVVARLKALEGEVNRINKEIQSVLKDFVTVKNTFKAAKVQYADNSEKYKALKESRQAERDEITAKLDELKKKVDPALMERYIQKRNDKIFPVLFEINGNVCGACSMNLSMADIDKLKNGEIIECDNCRRLIYKK